MQQAQTRVGYWPKPLAIFVTYVHEGKEHTERLSAANTVEEAKAKIAADLKALMEPNTFGGLIGWPKPSRTDLKNRKYQIFKATWEEVA
jgi:hypothetical protein